MHDHINMFFQDFSSLLLLLLTISGSFLIIAYTKISQQKRLNKEMVEYMVCIDEVLEEFKKIRHEYNNILQTITCLIEEKDLEGLEAYNSKILEKTYLINKNKLTQLAKIKDKSILKIVYKLLRHAKEIGITVNLTIYNDIFHINSYKTKNYNNLEDYLNYAYAQAIKEAREIDLKISINDKGLCFYFETCASIKEERLATKPIKLKKISKRVDHIFFNSFFQEQHLIQEIIVLFKL